MHHPPRDTLRVTRRVVAAVVTITAALLAGLLSALVTAQPATAALYDTVRVDDPVGDAGAAFPDVVVAKFQHDVTDDREYLVAKFQLRRDVRWTGIRTVGFRANGYSVTTNSFEHRYRVHIRRPGGSEYVCKRCSVKVMPQRRRIVFVLPWPRIGRPAQVRLSASYVSAGYLMDTVAAPSRVLY